MAHRTTNILLVIFSILTFLAAVCQISFAGAAQHIFWKHRHSNTDKNADTTFYYGDGWDIPYAPDYEVLVSTLMVGEIGAGAIGLVAVLFTWTFWSCSLRYKYHTGFAVYASMLLFFGTAAVIGISAWAFNRTAKDLPITYELITESTYSWIFWSWDDNLTWEGWVCQVEPHVVGYPGGGWWKKSCNLTRASRWTLIPLTVLLIGTTVLVIVFSVQEERNEDKKKKSANEKPLVLNEAEVRAMKPI